MPDMEEVGLIGLTHILNGGVRIQYNPSLCYARNGDSEDDDGSINWSKILKQEYSKAGKIIRNEYLIIEVTYEFSSFAYKPNELILSTSFICLTMQSNSFCSKTT